VHFAIVIQFPVGLFATLEGAAFWNFSHHFKLQTPIFSHFASFLFIPLFCHYCWTPSHPPNRLKGTFISLLSFLSCCYRSLAIALPQSFCIFVRLCSLSVSQGWCPFTNFWRAWIFTVDILQTHGEYQITLELHLRKMGALKCSHLLHNKNVFQESKASFLLALKKLK